MIYIVGIALVVVSAYLAVMAASLAFLSLREAAHKAFYFFFKNSHNVNIWLRVALGALVIVLGWAYITELRSARPGTLLSTAIGFAVLYLILGLIIQLIYRCYKAIRDGWNSD